MANFTTNAARMKIFNDHAAYISTVQIAADLYGEYVKVYKNELGHSMALHCAMAYVYWVGMTEGIRKERKRKKAR